ncbi:MAG: ATP-grasp domain-containing protein [Candidatus Moranbacteria bacterium]|nr:ATP-grasp domain-containing protein [Candidatus Moranbacteria bacterium]
MQKVMILFGKSDWRKAKPFANKDYQYSYEYFYSLCKKNNIQMYRASYQWYDHTNNLFKYAWLYEGEGGKWKKVKNIKPALVYDKTKARMEVYHIKELIGQNYPFINDQIFTRLIDDKFTTSLIFEKWSKKNWLIQNHADLKKTLPKITTSKVVLKPLMESGGKGVQVLNKKDAASKAQIEGVSLIQDFIDSSNGVPGVSTAMHDLRVVMINEKIIYAYIREPQAGSYLANLAQGGSLKIVPKEKLPKALLPIINFANNALASFNPRIFSIDFMFDENKKPWVVELNSMPGLFFTPEEKPYMLEMYAELLQVFKTALKK